MVVAVTFLLKRAEAVQPLLLLWEPAQFSREGGHRGIFQRVHPPVMGLAASGRSQRELLAHLQFLSRKGETLGVIIARVSVPDQLGAHTSGAFLPGVIIFFCGWILPSDYRKASPVWFSFTT